MNMIIEILQIGFIIVGGLVATALISEWIRDIKLRMDVNK